MKCAPNKIPNGHKKSVQREPVNDMRYSQNNLRNRVDSSFHMTLLTEKKIPF